MRPRRDIVDIPGMNPAPTDHSDGGHPGAAAPRPWLGVMFRCCSVYSRIYRAPHADRYVGNCPRCGAQVRARVGDGGTSQRIFYAE